MTAVAHGRASQVEPTTTAQHFSSFSFLPINQQMIRDVLASADALMQGPKFTLTFPVTQCGAPQKDVPPIGWFEAGLDQRTGQRSVKLTCSTALVPALGLNCDLRLYLERHPHWSPSTRSSRSNAFDFLECVETYGQEAYKVQESEPSCDPALPGAPRVDVNAPLALARVNMGKTTTKKGDLHSDRQQGRKLFTSNIPVECMKKSARREVPKGKRMYFPLNRQFISPQPYESVAFDSMLTLHKPPYIVDAHRESIEILHMTRAALNRALQR